MTKLRALLTLAGLLNRMLYFVGTVRSANDAGGCEAIKGTWHMTYSGTSCKRDVEEGSLTLRIEADCSFDLKRESTFPFISSLLVNGKSLDFNDGRIQASVAVDFDNCGEMELKGTVKSWQKEPQISGVYQYDTTGGGRFRGALEKKQ